MGATSESVIPKKLEPQEKDIKKLKVKKQAVQKQVVKKTNPKKSWWDTRNAKEKRGDIFYPHNAHMQAMDEEGDSCLLCHTFNKNFELKQDRLRAITTIANESLEKICHDCHVDDLRAPWRCELCHPDPEKIWPNDHNFNYTLHHSEDARRDEKICKTCHLDLSFCTNCHLRRDTSGADYHPMGYQSRHGMEARMMAGNCGRCHNSFYCRDCHQNKE